MKYKKVYFKWADTTSPVNTGQSWWSEKEVKEWAQIDDFWVEQLGFLIEKNKKFILVASHVNITSSGGEEIISLGGLLKVPTTWIKNYKEFK